MTQPNQPDSVDELQAIKLASIFHDTYETLAPAYGYETRPETREFDHQSPNGKLMTAVCQFILETEILPLITQAKAEEREKMSKEKSINHNYTHDSQADECYCYDCMGGYTGIG